MTQVKLDEMNSVAGLIRARTAQLGNCLYNHKAEYSIYSSTRGSYIALPPTIAESIVKETHRLLSIELQELQKEFKEL